MPRALLEEPCAKALFGILVEGLADRFEPALCDVYARLFSQAIAGQDPAALVARYERVRRTRPVACEAAARPGALARHAGRGCRGDQRPARRRQTGAFRMPKSCSPARARTSSCSPPIPA